MTEFHTRAFIEAIHAEQLRLHGGAAGLRDEGMLESALARPLQKESYGTPDLFLVFIGYSLEVENEEELIQFVLMAAAGEIDEDGAAAFFRDFTVLIE